MAAPISAHFIAAAEGTFQIERITAMCGEPLAAATALSVVPSLTPALEASAIWTLRGSTGHVRYVEQAEKVALARVTPPLGRPSASCAAMIPIRKSDAWWELAQDERRAILEAQSKHIAIGLRYLPAIARRLYHGRELGEPFDFVTWFEFAPEHAPAFDELLALLRATEEWRYVDREVELRLRRA
jgi:hypothetical protein